MAITVQTTSKRRGSSGVQDQVRKPNPVQARVPMAIRRARQSNLKGAQGVVDGESVRRLTVPCAGWFPMGRNVLRPTHRRMFRACPRHAFATTYFSPDW